MTDHEPHFAVMFADIAGSTRLYEKLGNKRAQAIVAEVLALLSVIIQRHGGTVVKTIGDEIMSHFPNAHAGASAALEIQQTLEKDAPRAQQKIAARIGLHWGPALLKHNDLFGDAVNIAAAITGIARARQIITTGETIGQLTSPPLRRSRLLDHIQIKGKQQQIIVHELIWEEKGDVTTLIPALAMPTVAADAGPLILRCGTHAYRCGSTDIFMLGRADDCALVVPSHLASRQHARIECRRGKYMLMDQSTNGTWLRNEDQPDIYLRREEIQLRGRGLISLGEAIQPNNPALINFETPA